MRFNLAPDKAGHYIAGTLAAATGAMAGVLLQTPVRAWWYAIAAAAVAGALKEARDWWQNRQAARRGKVLPHSVEGGDFVATLIGAVPVAAPLLLLALMALGLA
jgi:hypothetical protein